MLNFAQIPWAPGAQLDELMGKRPDNHWRILGSEQREPRPRNEVFKDIALALVTNHGVGNDSRRGAGSDPYDSRLGTVRSEVWVQRRRA